MSFQNVGAQPMEKNVRRPTVFTEADYEEGKQNEDDITNSKFSLKNQNTIIKFVGQTNPFQGGNRFVIRRIFSL